MDGFTREAGQRVIGVIERYRRSRVESFCARTPIGRERGELKYTRRRGDLFASAESKYSSERSRRLVSVILGDYRK